MMLGVMNILNRHTVISIQFVGLIIIFSSYITGTTAEL
jgi:hypothetical protein